MIVAVFVPLLVVVALVNAVVVPVLVFAPKFVIVAVFVPLLVVVALVNAVVVPVLVLST